MSPVYHLMTGSFIAHARPYSLRERRFIMLASLAPDLDGIFFIDADLWERVHHTFSHNVYFALLVSLLFSVINRARRLEIFFVCLLTAVLQLLVDGVTNDPSWRQRYLWPLVDFDFSPGNFISWPHLAFLQVKVIQVALMVLILAGAVVLYARTGHTFIELFSRRLDRFLTDFVVFPFSRRCAVCGRRSYYRDSDTGDPLCPYHARIRGHLRVERKVSMKDKGPGDD